MCDRRPEAAHVCGSGLLGILEVLADDFVESPAGVTAFDLGGRKV
jgi:hypothetical protein